MNLLWVENHARFAAIVQKTFLAGHSVRLVPTLQAARSLLTMQAFDAVLLDYDLDDGKGTDLLPDLLVLSPRPPILAVSSHAAGNAAMRQAGADTVCGKMEFERIGEVLAALTHARLSEDERQ